MTTIAVRDGVMAGDTLSVWDRVIVGERRKIERANDALVGCAGATSDWLVFVDWYRRGADRQSLPYFRQYSGQDDAPDFDALVLGPDGLVYWTQHFQPAPLYCPFWAIGSGAQAALAAMHMGATAAESIAVAAKVDVFTGGTIQVEKFDGDD